VISTFILVAIYLLVATAAQAYGGLDNLVNNSSDVFAPLGKGVLGSGLDKILIIAVLSSGITGFACVIYYRRHLFDSVKNFVMIGVLPFVGGAILTWVLIKAVIDYSKADGGYAKPVLGIGSPIAIAILTIILGLIAMLYQRIAMPDPRSAARLAAQAAAGLRSAGACRSLTRAMSGHAGA
jgi:hypothetical protein